MEVDLTKVTIRSSSNGTMQGNAWRAYIEDLFFKNNRGSREKERFFIGNEKVFKTYSEALNAFLSKLQLGMMQNSHGTLKWNGQKFYMEYKEGFSAPVSKELEDLDKYKKEIEHKQKCNDPNYLDNLKKKLEEKKEQEEMVAFIKRDTSKMKRGSVQADPLSEDVMTLITNKAKVEGSNSYFFNESIIGTLVDSKTTDDKPFKVKVGNEIVSCSFVRSIERRVEPYALADAEVRHKLFGRTYKSKDGSVENMVTTFTNVSGWKINGMSAQQFLTGFVWIDTNEPCGEVGE